MRLSFLLPLLVPASVYAMPAGLKVDVTHLHNSRGLTHGEARQVWQMAKDQISEETGVDLRLASWRSRPVRHLTPQGPAVNFLGPHRVAVNHYWAQALESTDPNRISLIIAPRYRVGRRWWNAGLGELCDNHALVVSGNLRRFGANSLSPAAMVLTHELGHVLGAEHSDASCQVMHPAAGTEGERCGWGLPFAAESLGQIRLCMGGR